MFDREKVKIDTMSMKKSRTGEPPAKQQKIDSKENEDAHEMVEKVCYLERINRSINLNKKNDTLRYVMIQM